MPLTIRLSARRIGLVLGLFSAYVALQSIIAKKLEWDAGVNSTYWLYHFVEKVNVNRENNFPSWYSSLLLFSCALLLFIILRARWQAGDRFRFHWALLTFVFLFLSLDEAASLHEVTTIPLQEDLGLEGYLYFGWVLVGVSIVTVLGLIFLPFVLGLPGQIRLIFILAAGIYLSGALFIESVSANQWYLDEGTSLRYSAIGTLEEFMEMTGAVVFLYGLLRYLETQVGEVRLSFGPDAEQTKTG